MAGISATERKFILHWGEMGSKWGVNRTVAQVHALLYVSPQPLAADDIVEALGVARSNVSTSLKELQGWGIVRVVHVMGDRRDRFESLRDVWEMFQIVLDERKRREIDPTIRVLQECVDDAKTAGGASAHTRERLEHMLEFMEMMDAWYGSMRRLPRGPLLKMLRLGGRVADMTGRTGSRRRVTK